MAKIDITKTELVWPGKYNEDGTLRETPRVSLPFQVIETVNETRATRQAKKAGIRRGLFDTYEGKEGDTFEDGWKNKLIWGDNLLVMGSLLEKFAGKIDLIYIDPPFATGADFSFSTTIGESDESIFKEQSVIEEKAYRDTWGRGSDSYLSMVRDRLNILYELLNVNGSIYIHLDYRMALYIRCLMDEIFGQSSFRNEIIWQKCNSKNYTQSSYSNIHDTILFYTKSQNYYFGEVFEELDEKYVERSYRHKELDGRLYRLLPLHAPGIRKGATGRLWRDEMPLAGNHWRFHPDTLDKMYNENLIVKSDNGVYSYKKYLSDSKGVRSGTIWLDAKQLPSSEKVDYATQKPEIILRRIIEASSNPGDLVADFFCGSGTTLAVAEKLGRRWIGCDLGRWAVHVTRKRLLGIQGCKPFEVLNLGKYERQYWQGVTFGEEQNRHVTEQALYEYLAFILKLYGAQPLAGLVHLHGKKGRAMVHIGAVDAPVTITEIDTAVEECVQLKQAELHVLGWEWEMGLYDLMVDAAKKRGVKLLLLQIPREVMEQQAAAKGDVRFFELAYLEAEIKRGKDRVVKVALKDFVIPNTELIPEAVRDKVQKSSDYIDYWAVDWDFQHDTFMQGWVAFRTRKDRKLPLESDPHQYPKPGTYRILVKVIDIFGNDTSQAFDVEVGLP